MAFVERTLLVRMRASNGPFHAARGFSAAQANCAETELPVKRLLIPCCNDGCLRIVAIEMPGEALGLRVRGSR